MASGLAAWIPSSDAPAFFGVDRSRTKLWQHPCLKATPPVPWPNRSAAGICHDHPDCNDDPVMAARCRGFSDACEQSAEDALIEGVHIVAGIDLADALGLSSQRVSKANAPEFVRTGFGEYRLTLPIT